MFYLLCLLESCADFVLTNAVQLVLCGLIARVAGTLILSNQVDTAAIAAQVAAQLTFINICAKEKEEHVVILKMALKQALQMHSSRGVQNAVHNLDFACVSHLHMQRYLVISDGLEGNHSENFPLC